MSHDQESRPLFGFYGDDFTGSTDVLEAFGTAGIPAVLFLKPPNARLQRRYAGCLAVGLAGESRSRSPKWMRRELPALFEHMASFGAPIFQYKVCSTFDSAPETGSIGCAIEIGRQVFGSRIVPVIPAAPRLGRFVAFSNLFANQDGKTYRIDRHPTMRHHPVTPMTESDLRMHLAQQTSLRIFALDLPGLRAGDATWERLLAARPDIVLFDGVEEETLVVSARRVWENRTALPFVVAASGFTYGLIEHWRRTGPISAAEAPPQTPATGRILVLSGSCSPATELDLRHALANGFAGVRVDAARLLNAAQTESYTARLIAEAAAHLSAGRSVALYSALGPQDCSPNVDCAALARACGRIAKELIARTGVRRPVVAGGDTASHAVRELDLDALSFAARAATGAPLCRAQSPNAAIDGLEFVLKGGQVGAETFFLDMLQGTES